MNKKNILKKVDKLGVDYKLVSIGDYTELVLYPDNYKEDEIYFTYCEFIGNRLSRLILEDSKDNYYDNYNKDIEFLMFVKNFKELKC